MPGELITSRMFQLIASIDKRFNPPERTMEGLRNYIENLVGVESIAVEMPASFVVPGNLEF